MNVDKASAASTTAPLAPPDWSMEVQLEGSQFTAEVKRAGTVMCRLSVVRSDGDEAAARTALADKARRWIHDYLSRANRPLVEGAPSGVFRPLLISPAVGRIHNRVLMIGQV